MARTWLRSQLIGTGSPGHLFHLPALSLARESMADRTVSSTFTLTNLQGTTSAKPPEAGNPLLRRPMLLSVG